MRVCLGTRWACTVRTESQSVMLIDILFAARMTKKNQGVGQNRNERSGKEKLIYGRIQVVRPGWLADVTNQRRQSGVGN